MLESPMPKSEQHTKGSPMIDTTIISLDIALTCLFDTLAKTKPTFAAELSASLSSAADQVETEIPGELGDAVKNRLQVLAKMCSQQETVPTLSNMH